jgi:predicted nucleic acid-binding Zn finger protein
MLRLGFNLDKIIQIVDAKGQYMFYTLLQNKADDTWQFINLSEDYICPTKYCSYDDAINDLELSRKDGCIRRYSYLYGTMSRPY